MNNGLARCHKKIVMIYCINEKLTYICRVV